MYFSGFSESFGLLKSGNSIFVILYVLIAFFGFKSLHFDIICTHSIFGALKVLIFDIICGHSVLGL